MTVERTIRFGLVAMLVAGCPGDDAPAEDDTGSGSESGTGDGPGGSDGDGADETGDTDGTGDADGTADTGDDPPDPPGPPLPCPEEWHCKQDVDRDGVPLTCDTAPRHYNPDQSDLDFDSWGDVIDRCPTVQSLSNEIDSDRDGVGNDCDTCRRPAGVYEVEGAAVPDALVVRSVPLVGDVDRDGIGDACDNCPTVPNCLDFGDGPGLVPWAPGMPIVDDEDPACQADADDDGIGDACEGTDVGYADGDDLDGDGLPNGVDLCPRVRSELSCADGCPQDAACIDGVCNHSDPDDDGVGTECDTCPFDANPEQLVDGLAQEDDIDGDFVGAACDGCPDRPDPRRLAFYDVAVGGYCCTTVYQGDPLADPDGNPLRPGDLPVDTPGLVTLPPGCEAALATAGVATATRLRPEDVGGLAALWDHRCLLPPHDEDLDGLPDECDLCPHAFDPTNAPFVDVNGMTWPNDGAYCNGEYACDFEG